MAVEPREEVKGFGVEDKRGRRIEEWEKGRMEGAGGEGEGPVDKLSGGNNVAQLVL